MFFYAFDKRTVFRPKKVGTKPTSIKTIPVMAMVLVWAKNVPVDKIPKISKVEKGNEKAMTNTANSALNVRRSLGISRASSRELKAEMCANGQKLAELNGITVANKIIVGS